MSTIKSIDVGNVRIDVPLVLAPMAGITDLPFRNICKRFGVGLVVTEMIASRAIDARRYRSLRMAEIGPGEHPVSLQIAGSDPDYMRDATLWAADRGVDILDINMGCPVKKICNQQAGSALLRDEKQVALILKTVVDASPIPVTLKIRTGWDEHHKNVADIARIAEDCGVKMLTVHGRTRAQMFNGQANWEDIAQAKSSVSIPVIANGDIVDGATAAEILRVSGADGVMVGRAVQGNPWVLGEVYAALTGRPIPARPTGQERWDVVYEHMQALREFHGEDLAGKLVRKHVIWYSKTLRGGSGFRKVFTRINDWQAQIDAAADYFMNLEEDYGDGFDMAQAA